MLKIKDREATFEIISLLKALKEKQKELVQEKMIYYPSISLYTALKNKICFKNLFVHPKVLIKRNFYDEKPKPLSTDQLVKILADVLEYEFSNPDAEELTEKERAQVIKVHKKLKANFEKDINVKERI